MLSAEAEIKTIKFWIVYAKLWQGCEFHNLSKS
jgi:hypothetical protein